ncbi:hypothetical protein [Nitrosospira sp. NpAV]|uniref:hypothetical protein n=1 Tax=Nitrosospira sp. NpAV TaxID=58133 RepID=UPI0005A23655|nr:hypothetical protein [Nitrosospira sp. NpAV]KIO48709.1 hypothetical protein SQ11_10385 [Nitrosospira sp. NpAV]
MNKRFVQPIIFALFVTMLTTGFGWAFNGEVFAHELDRKHHALSIDPVALQEAHELEAFSDGAHVDAAIDLCLQAAGQYQPFFFTVPPLVPASIGMEALTLFVSVIVPESIPDSPLHPPKTSFAI